LEYTEKYKSQITFIQMHMFPPCGGKICVHLHNYFVNYTNLVQQEGLDDQPSQIANHIYTKKNIIKILPPFCQLTQFSLYFMMLRGHGFTNAELDCLLDIIEEAFPIGPNDWDRVTEHHCSYDSELV